MPILFRETYESTISVELTIQSTKWLTVHQWQWDHFSSGQTASARISQSCCLGKGLRCGHNPSRAVGKAIANTILKKGVRGLEVYAISYEVRENKVHLKSRGLRVSQLAVDVQAHVCKERHGCILVVHDSRKSSVDLMLNIANCVRFTSRKLPTERQERMWIIISTGIGWLHDRQRCCNVTPIDWRVALLSMNETSLKRNYSLGPDRNLNFNFLS